MGWLDLLSVQTLAAVVADLEDAVVAGREPKEEAYWIGGRARTRLAARVGEDNALRLVARAQIDRREVDRGRAP